MKVDLLYSTIWYFQTDDVSERLNQIVKIILRYYIAALDDAKLWLIIFSKISTTLNNSIKYSFTIETLIQILYEFRTRKAFDLLRIDDFDSITSKTRNVTITAYSVITKNATAENDSSINRMSSFKIIIFIKSSIFVRKLTSRQAVTFIKTTFSAKETPSHKTIISVKSSTFAKTSIVRETSFIVISHIVIMNEYRSSHIDIKNAIVFAFLKMKEVYDTRH